MNLGRGISDWPGFDAMKERGLRSSWVPSACSGCSWFTTREAPVSACYEGQQYVGIDLHRRRTVVVRMTSAGERLGTMVRFPSTPEALRREMTPALSPAGPAPQVVLEATYGWVRREGA